MGLEERVYSVLVVSTSEKFNSALLPLLSEVSFSSVHFASGISAAQRLSIPPCGKTRACGLPSTPAPPEEPLCCSL